jgi:hypothetical protein
MINKYVWHISGTGKKWKVGHETPCRYVVADLYGHQSVVLPKSEYYPCDPPEKTWADITEIVIVEPNGINLCLHGNVWTAVHDTQNQRIRKVDVVLLHGGCTSALIIEEKQ